MSELPLSWIKQKIKDINCYKSSTVNPLNFPDEVFELFSVPSFPTGRAEVVSGKDIGSTKQIVQEGDVLLCKINPRINRVWTVTGSKGYRQIASSEWIVIRSEFHHSDFLKYFFREGNFRDLLCSDVSGVGGSLTRAKPSLVEHYLIFVAPQAEQTRIVEKLDEVLAQVDAIKTRLDSIPAILKRFRQSVLAAAVSGRLTEKWKKNDYAVGKVSESKFELDNDYKFDVPKYWLLTAIGNLMKFQQGLQIAKSTRRTELVEGVLPILRTVNYEDEFQKDVHYAVVDEKSIIAEPDDIILSRTGTVGRVLTGFKGIMHNNSFRLNYSKDKLNREYLIYFLQSPFCQTFMIENSGRSSQPDLTHKAFAKCPISVPSIEEQKEIVRLVDQYFAFADTIEAQVKKAQARVDNLTQSILAKAFRGELVAQNPSDEPAEKLLERIAQARKEAEALAKAAKKVAKTK